MARTPNDPTKAQVWITKGLDDLDFEFYIPQGPKGDPGGITLPSVLGSANLNTIVTSGVYRQDNGVTPTLALNYPTLAAGILTVYERLRDNTYQSVIQEYEPVNSVTGVPMIYRRYYFGNATWTAWRMYASARIDQTAGRAMYAWDDVNGREQLVYGDTGWRDISSLLIAGATGTIKIRRILSDIHIFANNLQLPSATIFDNFLPMPAGFANSEVMYLLSRENAVNGEGHMFEWAGNLKYRYNLGPTVANNTTHRFAFQGVSSTTQAWPTTLPGTAINGGIPNS